MNAREAMAALQAAPKFGNQVELLNIVERGMEEQRQLALKWLADSKKTIGRGGTLITFDANALTRCANALLETLK